MLYLYVLVLVHLSIGGAAALPGIYPIINFFASNLVLVEKPRVTAVVLRNAFLANMLQSSSYNRSVMSNMERVFY